MSDQDDQLCGLNPFPEPYAVMLPLPVNSPPRYDQPVQRPVAPWSSR
jgi:hypothetical protein